MREDCRGILICSDMDGTLIGSDGALSAVNAAAIRRFQQAGGRFTVATGRTWTHLQNFPELTCNAPLVCLNGADLCSAEGIHYQSETFCVNGGMTAGFGRVGESIRQVIFCTADERYYFSPADGEGMLDGVAGYPLCKIVLPAVTGGASEEVIRSLQADPAFGELDIFRSADQLIEIVRKGVCKGKSARRAAELAGDVRLVIGVGDHENDLSMMEYCDLGFAMGNGLDKLKALADGILPTNDQNGIAYLIEHMDDWIKEASL